MRSKTAKHIKVRIKNRKDKCRIDTENPITFYYSNNVAPRIAIEDLRPYNPNRYALKYSDNLPDYYRDFFKLSTSSSPVKNYQPIQPQTVNLPEVQFTITPQFDVIMVQNEVENDSKPPKKPKPPSAKKLSEFKPILPKGTVETVSTIQVEEPPSKPLQPVQPQNVVQPLQPSHPGHQMQPSQPAKLIQPLQTTA